MEKKENKFFNFEEVYRWAIALKLYIIMIIGRRSIGKTTATLKWVIKYCLDNGTKFAYIRRRDNEVKEWKTKMKTEGHKYGISTIGNNIYYIMGKKPIHIGQCLDLNTWDKNASGEFDEFGVILFDEFISQTGSYLKNEYKLFGNILITINRNKNKFITIFLGNRINADNPYHNTLGIDYDQEQVALEKYGVYCYQPKKDRYHIFEQQDTPAMKFAGADEELFNSAYGDDFLFDNYQNIIARDRMDFKKLKLKKTYRYEEINFAEYYDETKKHTYLVRLRPSDVKDHPVIDYSLSVVDNLDGIKIKSQITPDEWKDIAGKWYFIWREKRLYFNEFDTKEIVKGFIFRNHRLD